jgi:adhesin transport system outer membrane protein
VTAAGYERDAAEWGRFPTVSVDAGAQSSNSATSVAPTSTVRVEQPLWAGGRIEGQIDAARAQVSAAELAELDARRRLAEETAVAYVGWMDAAARVDIARESAVALAQLVDYVRRRETEGLASLADVSIGRARYSSALALIEEMSGAQEQARAQLEALMVTRIERGIAVNVPEVPDRTVADTEAAYIANSQLVAQRRAEVDAARAQAAVRKSALFPKVALRLERFTYQSNGGLTPPNDSRAMVVVQFSPDAGLASYSGAQAAQSRIDSALAQLAADENDARLRARANWAEHMASRRQAAELEPQVTALDTSMASFMRQFEAGRKSWLELLNTQREVVDARIALSRARTSRDQSALRLMVNTGTFWSWLERLPQ